jgi:Fic family protein
MEETKKITKPFKTSFLNSFVLVPESLPFKSKEVFDLDKELNQYERIVLNPDIEKSLLTKNELLTSFAISKAENSSLTMEEAEEVYDLIKSNPDFDFIKNKIESQKKLTRKDYEKLEFFNITKTFRILNSQSLSLSDITLDKLKEIHKLLTQGLDVFKDYLPKFDVYRSGEWRDNNDIRVGEYIPPDFNFIKEAVKELLAYLKQESDLVSLAIFHTALYAAHPFNNGNKRVCRILEHIILRQIGFNKNNLYSTSYYYHKEKDRYYKYLLTSLERKNLNYFTSFVLESVVLSIISVVKTSIEAERSNFLNKQDIDEDIRRSFYCFIKRREIQFKNIFKENKGRISRQTLVNHLNKGVALKILIKRGEGRNTYYTFNISLPEEEIYKKWLIFARGRLSYISDDILLV